jgi:hypothetical protein
MKKARWATGLFLILAATPLIILSCSSGGGGGESTSWNLAGTWNCTMNIIDNTHLYDFLLRASTWQITQSGNDITVDDSANQVWRGTIDGDTLSLSFEKDVSGDCGIRGRATLTIESNNRMIGNGDDKSTCGAGGATYNLLSTR